jgi:hypothetical protein
LNVIATIVHLHDFGSVGFDYVDRKMEILKFSVEAIVSLAYSGEYSGESEVKFIGDLLQYRGIKRHFEDGVRFKVEARPP